MQKRKKISPRVLVLGLLALITLAGGFLCFYRIGSLSFWTDELFTVWYVKRGTLDMLHFLWPTRTNMSLYYVVVHFWMRLFPNPSEGQLRAVSAICTVLAIPGTFLLGRAISEDKRQGALVGLFAALLMAVNAFLIEYAQELRSYSMVVLMAIVSTLLLIEALRRPKSWKLWLGYAVASAVGMYCHYMFCLLVGAQLVALLILLTWESREFPVFHVLAALAAAALMVVPLVISAPSGAKETLVWVQKPSPERLYEFAITISGAQGEWLLAAFLIASVFGIFAPEPYRQDSVLGNWIRVLFLICLIVPVILNLAVSALFRPVFMYRYLIYVIPFLAILAANGLVKAMFYGKLWSKATGVILLAALLTLSASSIRGYFGGYAKEQWRDVADYLATQGDGADNLRLYYPAKTKWLLAAYYDHALHPQDIAIEDALEKPDPDELKKLLQKRNYSSVSLVFRAARMRHSISDSIRSAIRKEYPRESIADFPGMVVCTYEPPIGKNEDPFHINRPLLREVRAEALTTFVPGEPAAYRGTEANGGATNLNN